MAGDHYRAFIEEAFIEPIRSVLIVDDDYPTYDEILQTANGAGINGPVHGNKAWRARPERVANLIATFRQRPRPLLVDIHDGTNVSSEKEVTTATHLHQCDLLVLDYELDRSKPRDGTRAIEILRGLMSNNHFNLVIIYTNEDLDIVFDAVRLGLIAPSEDLLSDVDIGIAKNLVDEGEDLFDGFENLLLKAIDTAQYFHSRQNQNTFLRTMGKAQEPYTSFRTQADRAKWSPDQRKIVLRHLLKEVERKNGVSSATSERFDDLEWSPRGLMWIKSDSAFVALSSKTDNDDDLLSDLRRALIQWSPRPSRLFLTKLRAEIDEYGVAAQGRVLRNHHALAYWYYRLLADGEIDDRRWRIAESVTRHSSQLLEAVQPRVEDFVSRLIEAELTAGEPIDICNDHFGVDLNNNKQKTQAILDHNAFVCSMEPTGWHLTTGHVFSMSGEHWLCLSPACDMVPSQAPSWHAGAFGKRLPFLGVRLEKIRSTIVPKDVHSNRYVFLRVGGKVNAYCFNDPSREGSTPRWEVLYAEQRGRFFGNNFGFMVAYIEQGKTRLVAKRLQAEVVSQLRYEYALNLLQKLGVSLTRVGLDFSAGTGPEA